jgi:hypothetical protein
MFKKIAFVIKLSLYPFSKLLNKLGVKYDVTKVINDYYDEDFKKVSIKKRAVLLPHCLIHKKCPAKFSKEDGILCISCGLCGCGDIKKFAEEKGYQFYITPSFGFTRRLIARKKLQAIIGAACDYEITKGLKNERVNPKGFHVGKKAKTVPKAVYISKYDCVNNNLDWDYLKKFIEKS